MPLFFQQDINAGTRLAIWQITEEAAFFLQLALPQRDVVHPHKRLQHLAGRYLLRYLFPQFPAELIRIADTRKPYLQNEAYHFSISHCSHFAAAVVSEQNRVGVDIEVITEKAARIRKKFASEKEWERLQKLISYRFVDKSGSANAAGIDALLATLIWSCKEAVFKWYGTGEVDFIKHIVLEGSQVQNEIVFTEVLFLKEEPVSLCLHSRLLGNLWMSYVVA